ncbi:UAA domain containing protein [Asbolus verrucosus]|uniref:UAA domain containing protein n=1 Tax=Asbolus verrucosus TaxID=1661398 RepID=A0A482VQK5_ASBVE|nr:UAA domain containing protein [Asbolus verrucosus]
MANNVPLTISFIVLSTISVLLVVNKIIANLGFLQDAPPEYSWLVHGLMNVLGYATVFLPGYLTYKYVQKISYMSKSGDDVCGQIIRTCFGEDESLISHTTTATPAPQRTRWQETVLLLFHFFGLQISYLTWGVLQEKVMTQEYRSKNGEVEYFKDSQFLVFVNRILAFCMSGVYVFCQRQARYRCPLYKYVFCSFSNIMSSWCQYEALKYVSFPHQVLAKAAKTIPVMIMGKIVSKTKYEYYEYVTSVLLSIGMLLFMLDVGNDRSSSAVTTFSGVVLLKMCKCIHCDYKSEFLLNIISHIKTIHHQVVDCPDIKEMAMLNTYVCKICNFETFSRLICLKHCTECSEGGNANIRDTICLKCCQCEFKTTYWRYLKKHMVFKHRAPELIDWFQCEYCPHKSKNKNSLKLHTVRKHIAPADFNWFKCKYCAYKTVQLTKLNHHVLVKHPLSENIKWYECERCSFKAERKSELKCHLLDEHGGPDNLAVYVCEQCPFKSKRLFHLQAHVRVKHATPENIKWFECEQCSFKVKYRNVLRTHVILKHTAPEDIVWYRCQHCSYKAKVKAHLDRHNQRKHTIGEAAFAETVKWYECEHCPYKVKKPESLKKHVVTKHTPCEDIKWLECEKCSLKMKHRDELRAHMRVQHTAVWFKCEQCSYKSKLSSGVKKHVQRKHLAVEDIEWLTCRDCSYRTKQQQNLKMHVRTKHTPPENVAWFGCEQCSFRTKWKKSLKAHVSKKHLP